MNRFGWLLRREWMQHHRGWLFLSLVPLGLVMLVLPFATIDIQGAGVPAAPLVALLASSAFVYAMMMLVAATVLFQAAGMARRDQQDRSIEFWLSLPTSHWQSVAATTLMHLVLMPLMALLIVFAGSQLVAIGLVAKLAGVGAVGQLADGAWLGYNLVALLRLLLGVVVAALWLSPVMVGAMASASWLKGWGVPALAAAAGVIGLLVKQFTGSPVVFDTINHWFVEALAALMPLARGEGTVKAAIQSQSGLQGFAEWMWADFGVMLRDLGHPAFAAALLLAAGAFALLVLRRAGGLSVQLPWTRRAA